MNEVRRCCFWLLFRLVALLTQATPNSALSTFSAPDLSSLDLDFSSHLVSLCLSVSLPLCLSVALFRTSVSCARIHQAYHTLTALHELQQPTASQPARIEQVTHLHCSNPLFCHHPCSTTPLSAFLSPCLICLCLPRRLCLAGAGLARVSLLSALRIIPALLCSALSCSSPARCCVETALVVLVSRAAPTQHVVVQSASARSPQGCSFGQYHMRHQ